MMRHSRNDEEKTGANQHKEVIRTNKKKLQRLLEPGFRSYFFALLLFAVVTAFFNWYLALGEAVVVLFLYWIHRRFSRHRRQEILAYIDGLTTKVDSVAAGPSISVPLPTVIIKMDTGEILWSNDHFLQMTHSHDRLFEVLLTDLVPNFQYRFLMEGKTEYPSEVFVKNNVYTVFGSMVHATEHSRGRGILATLYFVDITEAYLLRREYFASRPIVSIVLMDDYEETMKNLDDSQKSGLLAHIDEKINSWASRAHGLLRKFDRDRYLFVFEERYLEVFVEERFSLLEAMRDVISPNGVPVTLSIGIGKDGENLQENYKFACLSLDMSLSRGGDQVVIKNKLSFEFYGGRAKEMEKRTKVKARVMANTLAQLVRDSSNVLIMGHATSDIDSIGAAAGMAVAVRKLGRKPYIVVDRMHTGAQSLIERLETLPENTELFIDTQAAFVILGRDSLLIVVDTNRPDIVESPDLLAAARRVAVIDHHRRAAAYIDNAVFSFHEPFASSASELATELLQYILEKGELTRTEAEALLAGIVLDTKNFTMHTGVRTFEAAAFLRGAGADPVSIRRLFQNDLEAALARYEIVRQAQIVHKTLAVVALPEQVDRTVAAQAADELLDISGVDASFVLFPAGGQILLSARSLGKINVQVIMEKLGGGGHQTVAGAQVKDTSLDNVLNKLLWALDQYMEESGIKKT